ncbi:hypothetical protein DFH09DRAFT_1072632 [Mycena vulgaris]|nr:hypothetical protein DFH09DRAFT_1072632 [Mycena vulgaris]
MPLNYKSRTRKDLPQFEPQLPRAVWEKLKQDYPDSMIFSPFFSDMRHEMATKKLDCTVFSAFSSKTEDGAQGGSWLHIAVTQGDLPLARECVRLGTSIQHTDRRGFSALYLGCTILTDYLRLPDGRVPICLNLSAGRIPTQELAFAIIAQMLQICLFLIEQYADVNETHDGLSLLGLACLGDQWELINAHLVHGARPSPSSTPPAQLPAALLQTDFHRAMFKSRVSELSRTPRPCRFCPCGSGLPLTACHGQPEPQPYPAEYICPCGLGKIHAGCCVKWTDMYWGETWDSRTGRLERVSIPLVSADRLFQGDERKREEISRARLEAAHAVLKALGESGRIDPGFAAAGCRVLFQPPNPALVQTMSEAEWNDVVRLWNEAVDAYIASNVDRRTPETIENAAKVGAEGGPLHRRCEAVGCASLEDRDGVKLSRCGACNTTVYCGLNCQKSAWKGGHKATCKNGEAKIQLLPSQAEYLKDINEVARLPEYRPSLQPRMLVDILGKALKLH